jgi:hypothetical protein
LNRRGACGTLPVDSICWFLHRDLSFWVCARWRSKRWRAFLFLTLLLLDPVKQLERDLAARLSFAGQPT